MSGTWGHLGSAFKILLPILSGISSKVQMGQDRLYFSKSCGAGALGPKRVCVCVGAVLAKAAPPAQLVFALAASSQFETQEVVSLVKGGNVGARGGFWINRAESVFPVNAWHGPQLPAARLQLLGNPLLPGSASLSLSVTCEGPERLPCPNC